MKILKLTLCVVVTFLSVSAFAKPVIELKKWRDEYYSLETPMAIALEKYISIHYDIIVKRPWTTEQFVPEYQKRTKAFVEHFCPAVTELCEVINTIELPTQFSVLVETFKKPETLKAINHQLAISHQKVRITPTVFAPGVLSDEQIQSANGFSFIVGVMKWQDGVMLVSQNIVSDIGTYFVGYQSSESFTYFALDAAKTAYVFDLPLRFQAVDFAPVWKKNADREYPYALMDIPNLLQRRAAKRLKIGNSDQAFQWSSYKMFKKIAITAAKTFQSADSTGSSFNAIALKALISVQDQIPADFFKYLLLAKGLYQKAPVLDQFASRSLTNTIMRENLSVLWGIAPYQDANFSAQLMQKLDLSLLLEEEYMQGYQPELYKVLKNKELLAPKNWRGLSANEASLYLQSFVFPNTLSAQKLDDKTLNDSGFYRLFAAFSWSLDEKSSKTLVKSIIKQRF